jgi:hypothetical protein
MSEPVKGKPKWLRRKLLINEHFQYRFILFAGGVALLACFLFYATASYFFAKYTSFAIEVGLRPSDPFFKVLFNMENLLTYMFAFTSAVTIVVSIVGGLMFSNRVAGPMYRLRMHCDKVARGETLEGVSFRDKDYFHEVAVAYNEQMSTIRERLGATAAEAPVESKPVVEVTEEDLKKAS